MSRAPIDPTAAMTAATAGLLHALGVESVEQRDDLEACLLDVLAQRGHAGVTVIGLNYGVLRLQAVPVAAGKLRFDLDHLKAVLEDRFPGKVRRIEVRTG